MAKPKVLICYSNPGDTGRIRLDVEHSQLEEVLSETGVDPSCIKRLHASRFEDIIVELGSNRHEILQFSGHGDNEGIYLENHSRTAAELVDFEAIKRILSIAPSSLRALILTCCFSDSYYSEISENVPYLISISGPAPDEAAIRFSKRFYSFFLGKNFTIERAFTFAKLFISKSDLSIHLHRRGLISLENELKIEAIVEDMHSIILDLTHVQTYLKKLIPPEKDRFLQAICTSIKAHFSLFRQPMGNVAIPFGEYIGIFSWQNEVDPIVCSRVFVVSENISDLDFKAIAMLLARYTSLASASYRIKDKRDYPDKISLVKKGLNSFHRTFTDILNDNHGESLRSLLPTPYKVTTGIINANLTEADIAFADNEYSQCIIHLETALTTLHNFIFQIVNAIEA